MRDSPTRPVRTRGTSAGGLSGSSLLVWHDAKGARLNQAAGDSEFRGPELSPDGKYVAFTRGTPRDIWVLDLQNARTDRLTSHPADDTNPRWSPDGKVVAFDSARDGVANLYHRAVNAVGDDVLMLKTETAKTLSDFTRDGQFLIYTENNDIWASPLAGPAAKGKVETKPIQITKTPFIETTPRVSPDGRWIAYASNEPGEYRVYLQSFPDPAFRQLVSIGGGLEPRWSRDSKTLYFYSGPVFPFTNSGGMVMAATVDASGSGLTVGAPLPRAPRGIPGTTVFSVAPDGRFLLQTIVGGIGRGLGGRPVGTNREYDVITMIFNWPGQAGR